MHKIYIIKDNYNGYFNVEKGQKMYLSSKVVNAVKKIMKLIEWDNS